MLPNTRNYTAIRKISAHLYRTVLLTRTFGAVLLTAQPGHAWQQNQQMGNMPGMDMSGMGDMSSMGPSMVAMAGHMYITPLRP